MARPLSQTSVSGSDYQLPPEHAPASAGAQVYGLTNLPVVLVIVNVWFAPPELAFDFAVTE
jgi:hypothetical protein